MVTIGTAERLADLHVKHAVLRAREDTAQRLISQTSSSDYFRARAKIYRAACSAILAEIKRVEILVMAEMTDVE